MRRQFFHLEPPKGWMNDPNGLCCFGGRIHVYFQFCPEDASGEGNRWWGHYEGEDLLHWKYTGIAMSPDCRWDKDGVYSGSAVAREDVLYLYYTGNVLYDGDYDYVLDGREGNTLRGVSTDGRHVLEKDLLLTPSDYPSDCSRHVRDPKVFIQDGIWHMVLGARTKEGRGIVLRYQSMDGQNWRYSGRIETKTSFGYMWECPDLFSLEGREYLSFCPQGLESEEYRYQNVYQSGYAPLKENEPGPFTEWDMGFDFYAPQTFVMPDGRRLLIGWMGMGDAEYTNPTVARGWQHCLTVPRELSVSETGKIRQMPFREWRGLCGNAAVLGERSDVSTPFALEGESRGDFSVTLARHLHLCYEQEKGLLRLYFTDGELGGGRGERRVCLPRCDKALMLADSTSLEIYLNDGETVLSTRYYPQDGPISVEARGLQGQIWPMGGIEVKNLGT